MKRLAWRELGLGRVVHGVFTSGAGLGLAGVFNYLVVIVLSRLASQEQVGDFAYVISTATILATLTDFGLTNALTRAYHQAPEGERDKLLAMSLTVRWALSGLAGIVCLLSTSPDLRWVGLLLFLWPGESLLLFLNARLDFNRAGILRVASAVLYLLGAVALFMAFHDPRVAALARGLSFFLTGALVAWRVLRPRHFRGWRLRELLGYLRGATGFFALSVSSAIFGHIDVLLLAWLMSREDVGLYRPLFTLAIVPTLLSTVVRVPLNAIVSSGAWTERRALLAAVHTITGAIALISLSLLAALYALAPWLIELVLGPAYLPGVAVFRVVLLASVLQSFVTPYYSFLAMKGSLALLVALGLTSTLGLVLLDLLLIPGHGTLGAAWARTGVQILGLLMILVYFYGPFLRRLLPPEPDRREP